MSKLNVYHHELRHNEYAEFYLKYEADKVIEDIVKGASSMFRDFSMCRGLDTKSPLGRIADVAFKHWTGVERTLSNNRQLRLDKATLLRSNENLHLRLKGEILGRQNDKFEYNLNIRHQKYKRCLDKAKQCEKKCRGLENAVIRCSTYPYMSTCPTDCDPRYTFFKRWHKRWLELAEKFKEAK